MHLNVVVGGVRCCASPRQNGEQQHHTEREFLHISPHFCVSNLPPLLQSDGNNKSCARQWRLTILYPGRLGRADTDWEWGEQNLKADVQEKRKEGGPY